MSLSRYLVIDDHPLVAHSLRTTLLALSPKSVIDVAHSLAQADDLIQRAGRQYHTVLLDLHMPDCSRLQALARGKEMFPGANIVILSGNDDPIVIRQAFESGAHSYVVKQVDLDLLDASLRKVVNGESVWPTNIAPPSSKPPWPEALTKKERELVIQLVRKPGVNKDLARRLNISPATVKQHLFRIMKKAEVHTRSSLIKEAESLGLSD